MPRKKAKSKSEYGTGRLFLRGNRWWWRLSENGIKKDYPTGKSTEAEAIAWRDEELERRAAGPAPIVAAVVTVGELLDDYIAYMEANDLAYLATAKGVINNKIRPVFGDLPAASVTTKHGADYRLKVIAAGESHSTANRHLSLLRSAMNRGVKYCTPRKLDRLPHFDMVDESANVRTGFIEDEGYETIREKVCVSLKALFITGYHVSTRKGELLQVKWPMVDLKEGLIELEPRTTKNRTGRYLPIYGDMVEALAEQKSVRDAKYPECEHVFFWRKEDVLFGHGGSRVKPGSPIVSFKESWDKAVTEAGYPDLLFHDLRRSAQRNMRKAGIPQAVRMKISGHKTDSMERRYNIVDVEDIKDAAKKLIEWRAGTKKTA